MNRTNFVVSEYKNGIIGLGIEDNKVISISYDSYVEENVGDIYVGKVTQVVSNIQSVFCLYQKDKKAYIQLKDLSNPILLNRSFDGQIHQGDEILIQLDTEAIRTKDPVFTSNLSIAGKYCVLTSGKTTKAVSNKIPDKFNEILLNTIPADIKFGVVIRTNAKALIDENKLDLITNEINALNNRLNKIISEGIHRTVFSCCYKAPRSYLSDLRDLNLEYDSIVTDKKEIYEEIKSFLEIYMPFAVNKLSLYNNEGLSLNKLYSIDTKINELTNTRVWLKSGAYLIIEQTEAMHVIDVNSGKNNTKKNNAEYIYNINREAAYEIMRQIRLRNLSGMILVDFINMDSNEYKQELFKELESLARKDLVKTVIVDYTKLGLLEITRKKSKKSLNCQLNS